jgi:D-psicose/D-tagatose/L-ribulose 3-epimerase
MRVSLCNEVIRELPFERQCEFARQAGYDGLEIAPFTLSDEPHRLSAAKRTEVRRAAANAGIEISGLHYLLLAPEGLSITSADAAGRQRTVEVMRALCDLSADLGGKVLIHGSPGQRTIEAGREAEGRKYGADCFAAVADAAVKAGVTYCIEPLARTETAFVNTVAEAVEIVGAVGSPALRTMIDCSAAARAETETLSDLIRQWLPTGMIAHIHFNDPNRRGPGEGELKFAPILRALKAAGYAGNAAVEPFVYQPDGPTCAARAIGYIRGLQEELA